MQANLDFEYRLEMDKECAVAGTGVYAESTFISDRGNSLF